MKRNRAAIYARCSTSQQTLDIQLNDLARYAEARDFKVVNIYKEYAVSGSKTKRPALDDLMKAVRQRKFDYLLVWRLDRLGRNTKHLLTIIDELEELSISLVSHQEAIDLSTPIGRVMVTVLSALSSFEREILRERVIAGIENAKLKGKKLGRPKIVDEDSIKNLRSKGYSYFKIQKELRVSKGAVYRAIKTPQKPT